MEEIICGKIYEHISGMKYKVEKIILDATNYEKNISPKKVVYYIQLENGKFPSGTYWVREIEDFKNNFKLIKE